MVQPAALVGLNGPQVMPELWANVGRHIPTMHFNVLSCHYCPSFCMNFIHTRTFIHPPLGPPCRSGPDVSFGHVQHELIEICVRLAFCKSQLRPVPAQAHSDHPEMGGLDWLFFFFFFWSVPFLLSSSGCSPLDPGACPAALWCFLSFQAANVLKQHTP